MSLNVYPEALKMILIYLEALNEAEKKVIEIGDPNLPYFDAIPIRDQDETDYGKLVDEIGGAWSWKLP